MPVSPLLPVHIAGGIVGMLSGTAALIFRKGGRWHVLAGKIFVASMLMMSAFAVYLAVLKHQSGNIGGGILTFYLILTAWLTARRRDGQTSVYDWALLLIPVALGESQAPSASCAISGVCASDFSSQQALFSWDLQTARYVCFPQWGSANTYPRLCSAPLFTYFSVYFR